MLDEENRRLKGLVIATTSAYILGWVVGLSLNRILNSEKFLIWMIEYSWTIYLSWFLLFLCFCWIPLSIFLVIQGFSIRKQYAATGYTGDRTIGNLSVLLPFAFFAIYFVTRALYGI
jgi:hypothetical protein